jgi:hypothetical protein
MSVIRFRIARARLLKNLDEAIESALQVAISDVVVVVIADHEAILVSVVLAQHFVHFALKDEAVLDYAQLFQLLVDHMFNSLSFCCYQSLTIIYRVRMPHT